MLKRLAVLAVITAAVAIALTPGVAMANYSIHGGYSMDTDACAGCHRAHTAPSSIRWTGADPLATDWGSALLISDATENYEFCYACHDSVSLGADTNVETGIYEGDLPGNTPGAMLNGGGFDESSGFTSQHTYNGTSWWVFGGSTEPSSALGMLKDANPGTYVEMTCSSCHDVHGSSNYRLLKDTLPALQRPGVQAVGGYDATAAGYSAANPKPTPWVVSAEPGYPVLGWLLHEAGAAQVDLYQPNYTTPMYAKGPGGDAKKGMSGWCAGCHIQYTNPTGAEGNDLYADSYPTEIGSDQFSAADPAETYDAQDIWGDVVRHRHPINVPLSNYQTHRTGAAYVAADDTLLYSLTDSVPLAHTVPLTGVVPVGAASVEDGSDWIECLTCHRAHGSNATMTGYALVGNPELDNSDQFAIENGSNALLRDNNRAVCEQCHNK